jgi:hypothetical protein
MANWLSEVPTKREHGFQSSVPASVSNVVQSSYPNYFLGQESFCLPLDSTILLRSGRSESPEFLTSFATPRCESRMSLRSGRRAFGAPASESDERNTLRSQTPQTTPQ